MCVAALTPAHDVAEFLQVGCGEVVIVAVAALHVLVYPVEVQGDGVQQLDLCKGDVLVTPSPRAQTS